MTTTTKNETLSLWTIYKDPLDYPPGTFVARRFELDRPTEDTYNSTHLEVVRQWCIEQALEHNHAYPFCMPPSEHDQPHIVETWL